MARLCSLAMYGFSSRGRRPIPGDEAPGYDASRIVDDRPEPACGDRRVPVSRVVPAGMGYARTCPAGIAYNHLPT
jgi:hypothetical protein